MLLVNMCKTRLHNDHDVQCMPCHAMPCHTICLMMALHMPSFAKFSNDIFQKSKLRVLCRAAAVTVLGQSASRATKGGLLG